MKILITSDWHRDHVTGGIARALEVERGARYCVAEAMKQKVDVFLFGGDLCDPDDGAAVIAAAAFTIEVALELARARIMSVWIAGNHDVIEDGSGRTTLSALRAVSMRLASEYAPILVFEQPDSVVLNTKREALPFLALPFTATSHTYRPDKIVEMFAPGFTNGGMVFGHLKVEGVQPGEETTEMPRGRDIVFPREELRRLMPKAFLGNGHYHRRQVYDGVHIPGSLARLTFGEREHVPGFLIAEVSS